MAVGGRPDKIGKYEIVEVIGEGGMGAVYKATDPRIGRTVAIKVIKGDFSDNPELLKRFYREAQAVGNLQHPNIVVVYDLGEENGSPYLVMEYLNGIPLDKIIAQRQSVALVQKLGIIIEVLNALHYAHQHNIVHRDVKPANVMLLRDGHVRLLDFGIAREGDLGQTKTGQLMGTMWYMSPEQLNGESVDGRSDVYSTGILLFELLAYALPFEARDLTALIVKRLRGDPAPPLSKFLDSYPPDLDEIIAHSLTLDREQRFSSAEEFAFELSRLQERLKRDMAGHLVDQARDSIARSDLTKAKDLLSEVLRIDTQNSTAKQLLYEIQQTLQRAARNEKVHTLRDRAASALGAKQLDQAANLIEEAIKIDQTDPDLLTLREQVQEAKARTQQVKRLLTLANVAQQTGELVVARKAVEDALALDPTDTDAKLLQASVARLFVEQEKQRQIQQFIQAARREIAAHQFTAAQENIAKAREMDQAHPEIPGLVQMVKTGLEQESRQRELAQICQQIEQELVANKPKAARDIAASAQRKYPGEPSLVKLRTAADIAVEKQERQAYIEERIATASRLVDGGEASRALALLKDVERDYPTDARLREYVQVVREAVVRETAAREKQALLHKARNAMHGKSFAEAISVLEGSLVQFPEDAEIKDLLKTARDEFDLLSKKKQVDDVSKQAQDLLHSRAHTDAIRLLERTAAQVSDPELAKLLEYARQEAAKFRAGVQEASQQANQMLSLGQHSEAVTFLEAQADKYGKNVDFQVLLEQARNQAAETRRAKERLQSNLNEARAKLRLHDIHGSEALLHVCEREAADEPDVLALAIEIEEEKKAEDRRQAEAAERALQAEQDEERRQKEAAERVLQARQEEERRQKEAAERALQQKRQEAEAAKAEASSDAGSATRLFTSEAPAIPPIAVAAKPGEAGQATALAPEVSPAQPPSATALFSPGGAGPAHDPLEALKATQVVEPPEVVPKPPDERKKSKRQKESEKQARPAESRATSAVPVEATPLRMETVVEAPTPVAPIPTPQPLPAPLPQPSGNKRLIAIAAGVVVLLVVAVVIWKIIPSKITTSTTRPSTTAETAGTIKAPQPVTAILNITGAPPNATYHIGDQSGSTSADGAATIETRPGNYSLDMDAAGYKPFSQPVQLEADKPATILAKMELETPGTEFGTLVLKATVPDYRVFVGDRSPVTVRGTEAKLQVPVGSYKVHIAKAGYEDSKPQPVKIVANKPTNPLSFTLQEKPGAITVPANEVKTAEATPAPPPVAAVPQPPPAITAKPKAEISSFKADPPAGDVGSKTKLVWSTQGADKVLLKPGDISVPLTGEYPVDVKEGPMTWELIATGPGGTDTRSIVVTGRKPTPPVAPVQDEKGVREALEAWRSAYQSKDLPRMKDAYPAMPPDFNKAIKQLSEHNLSIGVDYQCAAPKFTGEKTAEMSCKESVSVVGGPPPRPRTVLVQFEPRGAKWVVHSLGK